MTDYKLPELPSDDELGITEDDRRSFEDERTREGSELTAEEMEALLGGPAGEAGPATPGAGPAPPRQPRVAEGPRSRWRGPVTLAVLVATSVVASTRTGVPRPVPANAPDTAFSSARAMTELVEIARRPRPIGSPEHARVRQLLVDRLRSLGLQPEIQTATSIGEVQGVAGAATVRNVVARLPGTSPTGAILLTAHYDTRELAPGAADDGTGIVAILEAIRALQAGQPVRNDVIVLFTDAEEPCLCGARAFVQGHPWLEDVSVVLSFEMRGGGGPSIMFETNEQNGWIVRALAAFDPRPFANSLSYEVYRRMPNGTDFTEFRDVGKQGLNFAALDKAWVYHQATDTPVNLSEGTLQHHGLRALAALRYLGDTDLRSVDAPDVVYFSVPALGLVVYDATWVTPISGLLLVLALASWLAVRARGARTSGIVVALGLAVLQAALAFGFALWLHSRIMTSYPEAGSLSGSVLYSEGWWVLAAVGGAFFTVTVLHSIARRWLSRGELALGAVVVPLVLAIVVGFLAPLGAMNLQWPVAAALLSGLLLALLGSRGAKTIGWVVATVLAVPVLLMLEPVIELVWLAMTVQLLAPLAVSVVVALHLCLPALDWLRHPNSWWAPLTALLVTVGAFAMTTTTAEPTAEHPGPSTLIYAYEHGTGQAFWASDPNADPVLDAAAIQWAAERSGAPLTQTRDMSDFGYPAGPAPVTAAPLIEAPPPLVEILSDTVEGVTRAVTLSVRSSLGAEVLLFQLDSLPRTRLLSINGVAVEQPDSVRQAYHFGQPDSLGVVLELRMPADAPIGLHVVEHFLRPRELLGADPFERPADLAPDVNAMSDRAVFRYSVAAYADPPRAVVPEGVEPERTEAVPSVEPALPADSLSPSDSSSLEPIG